jgi:hypothetical protein
MRRFISLQDTLRLLCVSRFRANPLDFDVAELLRTRRASPEYGRIRGRLKAVALRWVFGRVHHPGAEVVFGISLGSGAGS